MVELELDTKFVVGYLGTHGMAHGLENVVEAATLLRDDPGIIFLFAGAGAERRTVERMVRERGLPNVRLLPSQPKQVMPKSLERCDLALISLRDTPVFETVVPSKLFEAMGMGIPVLAIPKGETSQIVERTGAGLHVPPEDPARLSAAIVSLRRGPDQLSTMRTAALEAVTAYSRDAQAGRFLAAKTRSYLLQDERRAPGMHRLHASHVIIHVAALENAAFPSTGLAGGPSGADNSCRCRSDARSAFGSRHGIGALAISAPMPVVGASRSSRWAQGPSPADAIGRRLGDGLGRGVGSIASSPYSHFLPSVFRSGFNPAGRGFA